jgi:hypothetical protein
MLLIDSLNTDRETPMHRAGNAGRFISEVMSAFSLEAWLLNRLQYCNVIFVTEPGIFLTEVSGRNGLCALSEHARAGRAEEWIFSCVLF